MRMTREELKEIPAYAKQIERHEERLAYLKAKAESVPAIVPKERVQISVVDHSNMEADAALDLEREIQDEKEKLEGMQHAAADFFQGQQLSFDECELLRYRYLYCCTWDDIAGCLYLSVPGVYKMHNRIMDKLFPEPAPEEV